MLVDSILIGLQITDRSPSPVCFEARPSVLDFNAATAFPSVAKILLSSGVHTLDILTVVNYEITA